MNCGSLLPPGLTRFISANCHDDEICVDGVPFDMGEGTMVITAFCVSTENFVQIVANKLGVPISVPPARAANGYQVSGAMMYSLDVVVTTSDLNSAAFASNLKIEAQTSDILGNVETWRSLVNGTEECSNCGSIAITPAPDGTQRFEVSAVLQAGVRTGFLYITSIML